MTQNLDTMKGAKLMLGILCMLVWTGMCTDVSASDSTSRADSTVQKSPIRVWPSLNRKTLNIEIDSLPVLGYEDDCFVVKCCLQLPNTRVKDALVEKEFNVSRIPGKTPYRFKIPLPKILTEWTPYSPFGYQLNVSVLADFGGYRPLYDQYSVDLTFQGQMDDSLKVRVMGEWGRYAGYDGFLPNGEIDYRARMYRNSGYTLVRDVDCSIQYRLAHVCAALGLLYEPCMKEYAATNKTELETYLNEVSRWVKERANSAAVRHWLLPEMPDSVAEMCRTRISNIDSRPVLMSNDTSLTVAEGPAPEYSMAAPKAQADSIEKVAEVSILHSAPGTEYLYRVNCGGPEVTDSNGNLWAADTLSSNLAQKTDARIKVQMQGEPKLLAPADQPVLQYYRMCNTADNMKYRFPVDSLGNYCVEVYLTEPVLKRGKGRMFQIQINDRQTGLIDLCQMDGFNTVVKLTFAIPAQGKDQIEVSFPKPYAGHAVVSGIAVGRMNL